MDGFIRFVMREQRCEQRENTIILTDIAIESRKRQAGVTILTAQRFAKRDCPFIVKVIGQQIALIKGNRLFQ